MTDKEKIIKELKEALDSLDITNKYRLNLIRAIEYLQEEPVSDDWLDMSKIDCKIQYANIESGIHAHAEDYSFNIESQLFNQLTKEQQELWRKEIEQAIISGGHCGVELARDKRYKENQEPVSEELEEACEQLAENARKHKAETSSPFFSQKDYKQGVIDGAKWQEEKMMKDAVSAYIRRNRYTKTNVLNGFNVTCEAVQKFKDKDKVKVMLIKDE